MLEPNVTNTGDKPISMSWGRFRYEFAPGESKHLSEKVMSAFVRRFPQLKPYTKPVEKAPSKKDKDGVN